jgi:hypothetical protein
MLRQQSLLLAAAASLALGQQYTPACPADNYCKGANFTDDANVCGDWRLGPIDFPDFFPINETTANYNPFGDDCPSAFLFTWFNEVSYIRGDDVCVYIYIRLLPPRVWPRTHILTPPQSPSPGFIYPEEEGFFINGDGDPDRRNGTLAVDTIVDRFGSERGSFLAPYLSPYAERALPPSNLATTDPAFPFNYHIYRVARELPVLEGRIAPWFGQIGRGVQYKTAENVAALVAGGFLERVKNEDAPRRK